MKHISYEKIVESAQQWQVTESDLRSFKKTNWVVTEKVHGANFCLATDGDEVHFAKRKEELQPDEDFFGYKFIAAKLSQQTKNIFNRLKKDNSKLSTIRIYGELFGGEYPHPDVTPILEFQAIQTGVYYSPSIGYYAFDIAVEYIPTQESSYLDYDIAIDIFQEVGMFYAQPLFIGKFEEALAYNIEFESKIPALLGLPSLPQGNKAEGVVIKPMKSIYIQTTKGKLRPILKRKIAEFAEDSRYHKAEKWTNSYYKKPDANQDILSLVTETRLNNVISKIGRINYKDSKMKNRLVELLIADVVESYNETSPTPFEELPESLKAKLQEAAIKLVNEKFERSK